MNGKPYYSLKKVKSLIHDGNVIITEAATDSAVKDFKLNDEELLKVVLRLHVSDFYKCMPSEKTEMWQDVYIKNVSDKLAYVKLQIKNNNLVVIISFKQK